MRRLISFVLSAALAASLVVVLAAPASAQAGDLTAFCEAREAANSAETKKETLAVMDDLVEAAPADIATPTTELRALYARRGDRIFESENGYKLLTQLDEYIFANCPGNKVSVTAIDYEFPDMPATLPAGPTLFKLTNDAPEEEHELGLVKLTDEGAAMDPEKLLELPEKKLGKFVDFSKATFMFALPGASGYSPAELEPGEYVYACFIPVGGKKKGAPHFTQGMYGTLTVE